MQLMIFVWIRWTYFLDSIGVCFTLDTIVSASPTFYSQSLAAIECVSEGVSVYWIFLQIGWTKYWKLTEYINHRRRDIIIT